MPSLFPNSKNLEKEPTFFMKKTYLVMYCLLFKNVVLSYLVLITCFRNVNYK